MVRAANKVHIQVADPGGYDDEVDVRISKREALRLCANAGDPAHWLVWLNNGVRVPAGERHVILIRLNGEEIGADDE